MYIAEKTWLFWHAAVRRVPSDREHEFSQGGKSTFYEHVCLVTANSGFSSKGWVEQLQQATGFTTLYMGTKVV
jgi:hypothetical protein